MNENEKDVTKRTSYDVSLSNLKNISEIIKRTGESKKDLINRLIMTEHKKHFGTINEKEEYSDENLKVTKELIEKINSIDRKTEVTINAVNKIYCSISFVLKELIRANHLIKNFFYRTSLIKEPEINIALKNSNENCTKEFNGACEILDKMKPVEIINLLKK